MEGNTSIRESRSTWSVGCSTFLWVLLLGIAYWALSPGSPAKGSYLVSAAEHTYLETKLRVNGARQPYWVVDVYYTRVGDWLTWTERVYWGTMTTTLKASDSEVIKNGSPIRFTRTVRTDSLSRIAISCRGCSEMIFRQPARFPVGY